MNSSSTVSQIHALVDVEEICKKNKLPNFFSNKLKLMVLQSRSAKEEMLKTYAELFKEATKVAKDSNYNLVEVHKYSDMGPEAQVSRFKFLALDHTGNMPNPIMLYALEYSAYKTHKKEKKALNEKLHGKKV